MLPSLISDEESSSEAFFRGAFDVGELINSVTLMYKSIACQSIAVRKCIKLKKCVQFQRLVNFVKAYNGGGAVQSEGE